MKLPDSHRALRHALNLKDYTPSQHRIEIDRIAADHPHTIRFIADRADETCVPFALQLTDHPTYRAIAGHCDVFAGPKFMAWVIEHLEEIPGPQPGSLICYFSEERCEHVGVIVAAGLVTSKWGTYPNYEHGMAEVPQEYGDCPRFFARPTPARALSLFMEFARSTGLSDDDIAEALREWSC